jgi:hypothetical protein
VEVVCTVHTGTSRSALFGAQSHEHTRSALTGARLCFHPRNLTAMVTLTLNTALLAIASSKDPRTFALDEYDGVVGQQAYLALKCTKLTVSCKDTFSDPAVGDCVLAMAVRDP